MKSKDFFTRFLAAILVYSFFVGSVWAMEENIDDFIKKIALFQATEEQKKVFNLLSPREQREIVVLLFTDRMRRYTTKVDADPEKEGRDAAQAMHIRDIGLSSLEMQHLWKNPFHFFGGNLLKGFEAGIQRGIMELTGGAINLAITTGYVFIHKILKTKTSCDIIAAEQIQDINLIMTYLSNLSEMNATVRKIRGSKADTEKSNAVLKQLPVEYNNEVNNFSETIAKRYKIKLPKKQPMLETKKIKKPKKKRPRIMNNFVTNSSSYLPKEEKQKEIDYLNFDNQDTSSGSYILEETNKQESVSYI
ncbi:hypothetical protein KC460_02260 [Candidatus Dependentiae bacterium]|nr:hypothetical protein [Candidatus Dependentiae bacterium]